jgi:hypothetical protein
MTITAPETAARGRLIALLTKEFEPEGLTIKSDRLHESLGREGALGGVFPAATAEARGQAIVLESVVHVQLFRKWSAEVDPKQAVDPAAIEEWAERLRRAVRVDNKTPGNAHLWYYVVQKIDYPPDPSGNISRLQATLLARSQNPGVVETTG